MSRRTALIAPEVAGPIALKASPAYVLYEEQLINFDRSVMTYKMMNKICPESLWDRYKTRNMYSSYRTRNCTDIQLPRYNLEYSKKSFHYSGLKAWNEIPTIRELSTLQQLKKHLKIHLRS